LELHQALGGYARYYPHAVISRRLVDTASATRRRIALEDLEGMRQRTKVRKAQRYAKASWAFFQLRQFVTYKAEDAGVPVILVDPA
jgi:putative transposase